MEGKWWRCTHTLRSKAGRSKAGVVCFTFGELYRGDEDDLLVILPTDDKQTYIRSDDRDEPHWITSGPDGWLRYFEEVKGPVWRCIGEPVPKGRFPFVQGKAYEEIARTTSATGCKYVTFKVPYSCYGWTSVMKVDASQHDWLDYFEQITGGERTMSKYVITPEGSRMTIMGISEQVAIDYPDCKDAQASLGRFVRCYLGKAEMIHLNKQVSEQGYSQFLDTVIMDDNWIDFALKHGWITPLKPEHELFQDSELYELIRHPEGSEHVVTLRHKAAGGNICSITWDGKLRLFRSINRILGLALDEKRYIVVEDE